MILNMILKNLAASSALITILCALTAEAEAEIDFIDSCGVNILSVDNDGTYVASSNGTIPENPAELAGLATIIEISKKNPTPKAYKAVCSLFQKLSQDTLGNKKENYWIITTSEEKQIDPGIQEQVKIFGGATKIKKTSSKQGGSESSIPAFDNLTGMLNNLPSTIKSLKFHDAGAISISDLGERVQNLFISGETVICEEGKGSEELKETHGGAISYLKITDSLKTLNYAPTVIELLKTPIAEQTNQQKSGFWSLTTSIVTSTAKRVASVASNTLGGSYKGYAGLAIEYSDSRTTNLNSSNLNSEQENNASALNLTLGENTSALYLVNEKAYNNIKQNMMNPVEALQGIFSEEQLKVWAKKSTPKNDFNMNPNAYYVQDGDDSFLWVVKSREDVFKSKKDKTAKRISISFNENNKTGKKWKVDGKEVK